MSKINNLNRNKKKVAIALSGGVDSAAAAAILKSQGYDCLGIFLKFWHEAENEEENKCCSAQATDDARRVAQKLGFPFYVLNFKMPFKKSVVDEFLKQYKNGLTPNPCVRCNQFIKFGLLLQKARLLGCDYLATGHYVRLTKSVTRNKRQGTRETKGNLSRVACRLSLRQAKDKQKDQSYFLYTLKQSQLKHLLFPLGNYTKARARALAKKYRLPVYDKPESQEICFVQEKKHYNFLKRHLKLKPGPIKEKTGKILGGHEGLPLYTLGQRKGIKIGGTGPFYVSKINYQTNTLYVSSDLNDKLFLTKKFKIKDINWLSGQAPKAGQKLGVRLRHQAKIIPAKLKGQTVYLARLQRAVAPGQSAVFYAGQELLGGGGIKKPINLRDRTRLVE